MNRPWNAREKVRQGAHATLLVVRLFDGGKWKAAACGDACLLQAAAGSIEESFSIPFVGFRSVADGTRVDGQAYPIVVMDWVSGLQLDRAVDQRIRAVQGLVPLIDGWRRLVTELDTLQVAHGDLQPGNIPVDGDHIRLVVDDGMLVPAMAGVTFSEQGHANYQHPRRRAHG